MTQNNSHSSQHLLFCFQSTLQDPSQPVFSEKLKDVFKRNRFPSLSISLSLFASLCISPFCAELLAFARLPIRGARRYENVAPKQHACHAQTQGGAKQAPKTAPQPSKRLSGTRKYRSCLQPKMRSNVTHALSTCIWTLSQSLLSMITACKRSPATLSLHLDLSASIFLSLSPAV